MLQTHYCESAWHLSLDMNIELPNQFWKVDFFFILLFSFSRLWRGIPCGCSKETCKLLWVTHQVRQHEWEKVHDDDEQRNVYVEPRWGHLSLFRWRFGWRNTPFWYSLRTLYPLRFPVLVHCSTQPLLYNNNKISLSWNYHEKDSQSIPPGYQISSGSWLTPVLALSWPCIHFKNKKSSHRHINTWTWALTCLTFWSWRSYLVWVNVVRPYEATTMSRIKGTPKRAGFLLMDRLSCEVPSGRDENVGIKEGGVFSSSDMAGKSDGPKIMIQSISMTRMIAIPD